MKALTNGSAEQRFVRMFVRASRRERLLYELASPAKRYNGLSRFCHGAGELLDPARILMEGEDLERCPEFTAFAARHNEACAILSPDAQLDGKTVPLRDAVDLALRCLDAVVIVGSAFAVVFGEPMKGGRDKYLLSQAE